MISRTLIAAAVAAACTWPAAATAARDAYPADAGYWTVSTPSSVDESAPWKAADMIQSRRSQQSTGFAATASAFSEVVTPLSVNESAPWLTAQQARARNTRMQSASLPNPETPWSANESAPARYTEEMRDRARHVASVRQARVEIARVESERLAAIERERLEQERLANIERERLANAPESSAVAVITPVEGARPINTPLSAADSAINAPTAPGQQPTQLDQSVGLVDTRRATAMSVTTAPDIGAAGASASANENTGAGVNTPAGVGVTRSEGAGVNGTALEMKEPSAQPLPQASVSTQVLPDPAVAPSVSGATPEFDAAMSARGTESTPVNAYVTLHESAPQAGAR